MALIVFLAWFLTACLKEWVHALVARGVGVVGADAALHDAARPWRHRFPYLTLGLPMLVLTLLGIGITAPATAVDELRLRGKFPANMVFAVGPIFHVVLALLCAMPFHIGSALSGAAWDGVAFYGLLNVQAALFALLPLPPCDMYRAVAPWLTSDLHYRFAPPMNAVMLLVYTFLATAAERTQPLYVIYTTKLAALVGLPFDAISEGLYINSNERWMQAIVLVAAGGAWVAALRRR